jgi:hypothetical protein
VRVLAGTTDLVPAQLFEATRASQEDAAAQVAELQQQLDQQAAAQQVSRKLMHVGGRSGLTNKCNVPEAAFEVCASVVNPRLTSLLLLLSQVAAEAYVERVQGRHVQLLLRLTWCRWRLEAAAGRVSTLGRARLVL